MKRIDQKVEEIQKKDKRNRWLFIAFVILILAFMGVVLSYESILADTREELSKSEVEKSQFYKDLLAEKEISDRRFDSLNMSLRPEDYWDYIKDENSTEGYINYLTNVWGIKRDHIDEAMENLEGLSDADEAKGWIYIGKIDGGEYTDNRLKILWRKGESDVDPDELPKAGDIVRYHTSSRNRRIYSNKSLSPPHNGYGWRAETKAYVLAVVQDGYEIKAKIQYY